MEAFRPPPKSSKFPCPNRLPLAPVAYGWFASTPAALGGLPAPPHRVAAGLLAARSRTPCRSRKQRREGPHCARASSGPRRHRTQPAGERFSLDRRSPRPRPLLGVLTCSRIIPTCHRTPSSPHSPVNWQCSAESLFLQAVGSSRPELLF